MSKIKAQWHITLDVTCPMCGDYFDVMKVRDLELSVVPGTAVEDYEITCQNKKCKREFTVNTEW